MALHAGTQSSTTAELVGALADVMDPDRVRAAVPGDAVAGVTPQLVVTPPDEAAVAGVLRACSRVGAVVVPRGGGTALDWGAPPRRCDVVLSTELLCGVVDHAAADLVCVVRAGTRLCDLRSALAAAPGHAQRLAVDPPRPPGATVGGVLATDHAGGLRHRHGTPRDLLIGARFVLGDGTVASSGGRVVKNVAGYDIGRMLCGTLGSLAVVVEAAFKLHPLPASSATVVVRSRSARDLAVAGERMRALSALVASLDLHWPDGLAVARLEGSGAGVRADADAVARAAGGDVLGDTDAADLDARLRARPWEGEGAVAAVGVPMPRIGALLERLADGAVEAVVRAGAGTAEVRMPADAASVVALRSAVETLGGHLSLRRGGSALAGLVWPEGDPVAIELGRAVKASLDPGGTLPSGRRQGGV